MERHLCLLANLHEHKFAHTYVVVFGHRSTLVEVNLVYSQRVEHVLESHVVTASVLLDFMKDDFEDALREIHLACYPH